MHIIYAELYPMNPIQEKKRSFKNISFFIVATLYIILEGDVKLVKQKVDYIHSMGSIIKCNISNNNSIFKKKL